MELYFLGLLILLMALALTSGFPVAFALPGSAILTIAIAAACGYLLVDNVDAFFAQDGPKQWLSAGVTNFRSLYWDVERDTLIAIPLFIFMGIMLQRSRIAEDLLVAMAQLFGPIPGGLGISVVFVGALLAATTGIVGATVIAMGLISLPAMMRNNYSKSLATGTICASGTLGQIIPPSIVLIILADQLSSAADQASSMRKADYRAATGEFSLPADFDVVSASAGDMFMGAFIPGLVLVGLYMVYILVFAVLRPKVAPPVPYDGQYDRQFALRVLLSLVPPLTLIFAVLGSIIAGVATVNQAGAIGAIGALLMGSYRLAAGQRLAYAPAALALGSTLVIAVLVLSFDLNIKNITRNVDAVAIGFAALAATGLLIAIAWAALRAYRTKETLRGVMIETASTTSMVFIILIGAAMLTSAFRAFGGEELVKHYLTGLPGGFWTQFIVVMAVIFLLGFFLDFIEIAVVVVPIVAPILLANPEANITAVWLGVMVGLNIQTSFLTPPFGFALFYLRGVAPPDVRTLDIYRGAMAFILLQLAGLAIAGTFPSLVNYLPQRIYLTSETAPPPQNPKMQHCIEQRVFTIYDEHEATLRRAIDAAARLDLSYLPEKHRTAFREGLERARATFGRVAAVRSAEHALAQYEPEYRPLHQTTRRLQSQLRKLDDRLEQLQRDANLFGSNPASSAELIAAIDREMVELKAERRTLEAAIPATWEAARVRFVELAAGETKARRSYRTNVDEAYEFVAELRRMVAAAGALAALEAPLRALRGTLVEAPAEAALAAVESLERAVGEVAAAGPIKTRLTRARRALRGDAPDRHKAIEHLDEGLALVAAEVRWRQRAGTELAAGLAAYDAAIRDSIGLRMQPRLELATAKDVAACLAVHRDISLHF